jgi:hypothetical protein
VVALPPADDHSSSDTVLDDSQPELVTSRITLAPVTSNSSTAAPTDTQRANGKQDGQLVVNNQLQSCVPIALPSPEQDEAMPANSWFITSGRCQTYAFEGSDGSMIMGTGGTAISPGQSPDGSRVILLKEGKIVVMAGSRDLVIQTDMGNVKVAKDGSSVIERAENGSVRVANLSGAETNVDVTREGKTESLKAAPGEELVVADAALSDEDLIPVDGVGREPIVGAIATVGNTKVKKNKFNIAAMEDALLICDNGCFTVAMRRKMVRSGEASNKSAPNCPLPQRTSSLPPSPLQPVAFRSAGSTAAIPDQIETLTTGDAVVKHSGTAQVHIESSGVVKVDSGEVLIGAKGDTLVAANNALLKLTSGTLSLITVADGLVRVRNLYEENGTSIQAFVGQKHLSIASGEEILLADSHGTLTKEMKRDHIGRRSIKSFEVTPTQTVSRSDVSLISLINNSQLLRAIVHSNRPSDKDVSNNVLKMAACLSLITARKGPYTQVGQ